MRLKRVLLSVICFAIHAVVYAQGGSFVSGRVVDGETLDGIAGAVLEIAPQQTPDAKRY